MYAIKYFYVFLIVQPNVPFSFCSWQISFCNVTSSPCSGVRLETEKALESLKCSLLRRYLVLFSLWKTLGFDYLGLLLFTSLLCSALLVPPRPSWKRGTVLRLDSFPFLFLYLSQGCSAKSSPFSLPSVLPPLSIPKPQFSLFKITPQWTGLPFMCTGNKWLKRFTGVNLCTIEFFLREICNY